MADGTQSPEDVGQMAMRYRGMCPRKLFIKKTSQRRLGGGSLDWKTLKVQYHEDWKYIHQELSTITLVTEDDNIPSDYYALDCLKKYQSMYNYEQWKFREETLKILQNEGAEVLDCTNESGFKGIKKEMEAISIIASDTFYEEIINAKYISDEKVKTLEGEDKINKDDQLSIIQHFIFKVLSVEPTKELVSAERNDDLSKILMLRFLNEHREIISEEKDEKGEPIVRKPLVEKTIDVFEKNRPKSPIDRLKGHLFPKLRVFEKLGVFQLIEVAEALHTNHPVIEELMEKANKLAKPIKRFLGISVDNVKPMQFVKNLVGLIGYALNKSDKITMPNGKRVETYRTFTDIFENLPVQLIFEKWELKYKNKEEFDNWIDYCINEMYKRDNKGFNRKEMEKMAEQEKYDELIKDAKDLGIKEEDLIRFMS